MQQHSTAQPSTARHLQSGSQVSTSAAHSDGECALLCAPLRPPRRFGEGLLERLTAASPDSEAVQLLDSAVLYIVPNMCPDGSVRWVLRASDCYSTLPVPCSCRVAVTATVWLTVPSLSRIKLLCLSATSRPRLACMAGALRCVGVTQCALLLQCVAVSCLVSFQAQAGSTTGQHARDFRYALSACGTQLRPLLPAVVLCRGPTGWTVCCLQGPSAHECCWCKPQQGVGHPNLQSQP